MCIKTCVSILWHTWLVKNATCNLDMRNLWRHCDVIQGIFVLFWYQWTQEGPSYPLEPNTLCFFDGFLRSTGIPPPLRLWHGSLHVIMLNFACLCAYEQFHWFWRIINVLIIIYYTQPFPTSLSWWKNCYYSRPAWLQVYVTWSFKQDNFGLYSL